MRLDLEHSVSAVGAPSRLAVTCSFFRISSGVPSARMAPWCMTTMRSEYVNTTSMSCSTITAVMPPERTTEVMVSMIGALSRVLTPLVGSSRNSSLGRSA